MKQAVMVAPGKIALKSTRRSLEKAHKNHCAIVGLSQGSRPAGMIQLTSQGDFFSSLRN